MTRSPRESSVLGPAVLVTRAVVLSVVTASLALGAHILAVAMMPTVRTVLAALLAGTLVGLILGQREHGLPTLLGLLAVSQWGLHAWFTAMPSVAMSDHQVPYAGGKPGAVMFMVMTHGLATIGVAIWLRRCEATLWSLLHQLGSDLSALRRATVLFAAVVPSPVQVRSAVNTCDGRSPRPSTHLRCAPLLRGPPRGAVVAATG